MFCARRVINIDHIFFFLGVDSCLSLSNPASDLHLYCFMAEAIPKCLLLPYKNSVIEDTAMSECKKN